jgi:hypothetical protein
MKIESLVFSLAFTCSNMVLLCEPMPASCLDIRMSERRALGAFQSSRLALCGG